MDKKEEFKAFVRKYPSFATYVQNKATTWQELYELWDMYGDDDSVFSKYKTVVTNDLSNVINSIRNINMDSVKKNLSNIEKGIKLLQDFVKKDDVVESYEPRPIYKRFED
ncbi:MAG: hypothetical protein IJK66_01860 [Bacilli bacterium]|nr:hypothetical protein [Bacilli bacterium]